MSVQHRLEWQPGDLAPSWLALASSGQQQHLADVLRTVPRSREETANHMLLAPPWPSDAEDASARVATVINYLEQTP
jgi:hypothetical protein